VEDQAQKSHKRVNRARLFEHLAENEVLTTPIVWHPCGAVWGANSRKRLLGPWLRKGIFSTTTRRNRWS
jgi:hypothetical protein